MNNSYKNIDFTDYNNYRIDVSGKLDKNLSDIFGGLSISHKTEGDRTISYLEGKIIGQSELVGIINTLHNMRYNILSPEKIKDYKQHVMYFGEHTLTNIFKWQAPTYETENVPLPEPVRVWERFKPKNGNKY